MSNPTIEYDNGLIIRYDNIVDMPDEVKSVLIRGGIPSNLVETSRASKAFRDSVLADVLLSIEVGSVNAANVLDTLRGGMRTSPDGSIELQVYTEYVAAIAFAWGDTALAAAAIMRSKPEVVSTHTMSIVSAMTKQMPSAFYLSLLVSQGPMSSSQWLLEKSSHFPN